MNWDQGESKWGSLTSSAKDNWSKLTEDDLREIRGKREQLTIRIQETYGITKREADKQVWDWGKRVEKMPAQVEIFEKVNARV